MLFYDFSRFPECTRRPGPCCWLSRPSSPAVCESPAWTLGKTVAAGILLRRRRNHPRGKHGSYRLSKGPGPATMRRRRFGSSRGSRNRTTHRSRTIPSTHPTARRDDTRAPEISVRRRRRRHTPRTRATKTRRPTDRPNSSVRPTGHQPRLPFNFVRVTDPTRCACMPTAVVQVAIRAPSW